MNEKIPQLEPWVGKEELENLKKVIEGKWLTEGPFSAEFLKLVQEFTGAKYAVLANNGTLALYLGLLALGIKEGDEVIVSDFSFNASASTIVFAGAKPVFADVERGILNINPGLIEKAITDKTRAIMPVHVYGQSADMDPILKIAKKHNLKIIEDAAQGYGVFYKGKHTGTIGDVGMISFFADKTVTTGEGAVILTNDEKRYEKLRYLRNQGRLHSGTFIHPELGMNFRMTDLQCAVGVAQLKKFEEIKKIKSRNLDLYKILLKDDSEIEFIEEKTSYSNIVPFRANIRVRKDLEGLLNFLEDNGIQTRRFFYPLHRQPCFGKWKYEDVLFPESNRAYDEGLSLPVYCSLTHAQIEYICKKIREFHH